MVVLQNCVGFVEGESGSCSDTGVMSDGDGTEEVSTEGEDTVDIKEEVSIKVEEAIDIKDEIPVAITVPSINTEHEVRLWGVCEVVAANDFRPFFAPNIVKNSEIMPNDFLPLNNPGQNYLSPRKKCGEPGYWHVRMRQAPSPGRGKPCYCGL